MQDLLAIGMVFRSYPPGIGHFNSVVSQVLSSDWLEIDSYQCNKSSLYLECCMMMPVEYGVDSKIHYSAENKKFW